MYPAQTGYPSGQWNQGFTHGPGYSGPPPAKKTKGNPIITKYPPPPGYTGPKPPPAQFHHQAPAPTWPQQQQPQYPYGYGQSAYPGYPSQAYAQQAQYYAQHQQQQYPGYPSQYPQQQQYYPHSAPPTAPQQTWQHPVSYPQSAPTQQWQTPQSSAPTVSPSPWPAGSAQPSTRRNSSAQPLAQRVNFKLAFENNESWIPLQDGPSISTEVSELEDDYFSESYFASHPDEIVPSLSLGFLTWKAPLPTKRPLPATFNEAELEAIAPRKPLPTDDESISDYYIIAKRHDALLSVRQTDAWAEVKDGLIFQEFPEVCSEHITMSELIERYKNRPTVAWTLREPSPTPEPESSQHEADAAAGAEVTNGTTADHDASQSDAASVHSDVLGGLEQALQANGVSRQPQKSHKRSRSSVSGPPVSRPRALMPVRDQSQEEILAALGVTGSPKMVYETPGPAFGPPQQNGTSNHSRSNSMSRTSRPPPPPPPPGYPMNDRRSASFEDRFGPRYTNGYSSSRRSSNASQHTAPGSDFGGDQDATPRASTNGMESRKRAFEDSDGGDLADIPEQDEDATPKQQRFKQPRVDEAFKRRW